MVAWSLMCKCLEITFHQLKKIMIKIYGSSSSNDWMSEASPTLGCSIEISRDIIVSERA